MTDQPDAKAPRWSVAPYFVVDDVVATANYYRDKAKGVKITRDVCDQPYGCRDFDVEDCNGYRLCFGQSL